MEEDGKVIKIHNNEFTPNLWSIDLNRNFTHCKYGVGPYLYALVPKEWEKATGGYKRKKKRKPTKRKSAKRKSTKRRSKQRKYKKTRRRR